MEPNGDKSTSIENNCESEENNDVFIDVSIDNYDVIVENDIAIDDLETIRFESVPEKTQTPLPLPVTTECSLFGWMFMCFT